MATKCNIQSHRKKIENAIDWQNLYTPVYCVSKYSKK